MPRRIVRKVRKRQIVERLGGNPDVRTIVDAYRCERDLKRYMKGAWSTVEPATPFMPGWHLDAICEHLEGVSHNQIRKLIINIPPRFTKSTAVSVVWPTWEWTERPHTRFLFSSYAEKLSTRDAVKSRRLIQSRWYQSRWKSKYSLTSDQNAKNRYENSKTGYRIATSVGGATTGEGGDIIVVDDPHNVMEAYSEKERENVITWWNEAMSTRHNNPKTGRTVIIQQRVHELDLTGVLLEKLGWVHLCLPMEYNPKRHCVTVVEDVVFFEDPRKEGIETKYDDVYEIEKGNGAKLCPERFGDEEIADKQADLGLAYNAQYDQDPRPRGGSLFKDEWMASRWRFNGDYVQINRWNGGDVWRSFYFPECDRFLTADTAGTEKTSSDYTVLCVWAVTPWHDLLLMDMFRGKIQVPDIPGEAEKLAKKWNVQYLAVEFAASGIGVSQTLRRSPGMTVKNVTPQTKLESKVGVKYNKNDKVSRAWLASTRMSAGQILLPETSEWLHSVITELTSFSPLMTHAHDDIVDNFSYAAMEVVNGADMREAARKERQGEAKPESHFA